MMVFPDLRELPGDGHFSAKSGRTLSKSSKWLTHSSDRVVLFSALET